MPKRYFMLMLLALLSVVTYLDRLCIGVAGPYMKKDLGLSAERWGWVMGAFALTYALFEIPSGAWGDRFGRKNVVTRIVIWWSAFTALTGLAGRLGFGGLVAIRALFGMGEAGAYPNISGCISQWFPASERARAQGVVWGASRVGGALAPPLVGLLVYYIGWREAFWIFGSVGLVWVFFWLKWYHNDPKSYPGITPEELEEISVGKTVSTHSGIPWRKIFGNPQVWLVMVMYWCYVWGSMFYLTWFPMYLVEGRGFTKEQMAIFAAFPFLLGAAGNFFGGILSDELSQRYGSKNGRRLVGSVCLALSACCLFLTASTTGKLSGIVFLTLGFGIMDCMLPSAWAISMDIGKNYSGAVSGAMNSAGNFGGAVCSVVFGYLVEHNYGYNLPLALIGSVVLVSSLLFLCINSERSIDIEPGSIDYGDRELLGRERRADTGAV